MKKSILSLSICLFVAGMGVGWILFRPGLDYNLDNLVAMKWIDGKYGKGFYGVQVWLEPENERYSVNGRVWIGRGNLYWHDLGKIGIANSPEEAVQTFGDILLDGSILKIGKYSIEQKLIEQHR